LSRSPHEWLLRAIGTQRRRTVVACALAALNLGWSDATVHWAAWSAVEFFPPDLQRQVRRHERRYDAGIRSGLSAPPSWRAAAPGSLREALESQIHYCAASLRKPIPLDDLVEEIGVLAVRVIDASDPLAVVHRDPDEPQYAGDYLEYVESIRDRVRLVYYGQDHGLIYGHQVAGSVSASLARSSELYPYLGEEFFRTGELRDWRTFDDRSVAFGVAAISLSWALTDLANLTCYVWRYGGGLVPTPRPTPLGHVGPTITLPLGGGFPDRAGSDRGAPALSRSTISLPPP
jgi:hypothetical protein